MARTTKTLAAMQTTQADPSVAVLDNVTKAATFCIVEFQRADDTRKSATETLNGAKDNLGKQREKLLRGIAAVATKLGCNNDLINQGIDAAYLAKKPNDEKKMSSLKTWIGYLKTAASTGARQHVPAIFDKTAELWEKDENDTLYREAFVREQHMAIALIGQAAEGKVYLDESAIRGYATGRAFDRKYSTKEAKRLIAATKATLAELNARFPFTAYATISESLGALEPKALADRAKAKGPAARASNVANAAAASVLTPKADEPAEGIYDLDDDDMAAAMMAA